MQEGSEVDENGLYTYSSRPVTPRASTPDVDIRVRALSDLSGCIKDGKFYVNSKSSLSSIRSVIRDYFYSCYNKGFVFLNGRREVLKSDENETRLVDVLPRLPAGDAGDSKVELGKKFRFEGVPYRKLAVNKDGKRQTAIIVCVLFIYPDSDLSHWPPDVLFQGLSGNSLRHFTVIPSSLQSSGPVGTVSRIEEINRCVSEGEHPKAIFKMIPRDKADLSGKFRDHRGATPLHYAAKNGDVRLCEMLMINFENEFEMLYTKDECGRDALNYLLFFLNLRPKVKPSLPDKDVRESQTISSHDSNSEASSSVKKSHQKKSKKSTKNDTDDGSSSIGKLKHESWSDEATLSPFIKGQLDVVVYLLAQKPDLYSIDHIGLSSFNHLQNLRDIHLKYIIRRIDPCNIADNVVLHFANTGLQIMQEDRFDCDRVLLKFFEELPPGSSNYIFPPLHLGAVHEKIEFVEGLLGRGHDRKKKDINGNLPFHIACQTANGTLIKLLYFEGMEINDYKRGVKTVFESCIRKKKSMSNFEDACQLRKERFQLDYHFNVCIIRELEENIVVSEWAHVLRILPRNIQHRFLSQASFLGCYEAVKVLLESDLEVNVKDFMGRTALHEAMLLGRYDIMKLLLDKNADPNVIDDRGATPMHYACQCLDPGLVSRSSGRMFYGSTCSKKRQQIVVNCMDYMIKNSNVNLAAQDVCSRTPLLVAVHHKRYHVYKWLMENYITECEPLREDIYDFTILHYMPEMSENTLNFTLEKVGKIFEYGDIVEQEYGRSWLDQVQSIEITHRYWIMEEELEEEEKDEKEGKRKKRKIPDRIENCIKRRVTHTGYGDIGNFSDTFSTDLLIHLAKSSRHNSSTMLKAVIEAFPVIVKYGFVVYNAMLVAAPDWNIDCVTLLLKHVTLDVEELSNLLIAVVSNTPMCYQEWDPPSTMVGYHKNGLSITKYFKDRQIKLVKYLLDQGASPNFFVKEIEYKWFWYGRQIGINMEHTAMELAVLKQDRSVVEALLPFTIVHGCLASHIAASQGDVELTRLLLESAVSETKEGKRKTILSREIQQSIDGDLLVLGILKVACCTKKPTLELFRCISKYFPKAFKTTKSLTIRYLLNVRHVFWNSEFFDLHSVSPITTLLKNRANIEERHVLVSYLLEQGIHLDEVRIKRNRNKTVHAACEALSTAILKRQWECVNVLLKRSGKIFFQCQTKETHYCHRYVWSEKSSFPLLNDIMMGMMDSYPVETLRVHLAEAKTFFEQTRPNQMLKSEMLKRIRLEGPAEDIGIFALYLGFLINRQKYNIKRKLLLVFAAFQLQMEKQEMLQILSICRHCFDTSGLLCFSNGKDMMQMVEYSKAEKKEILKMFRKTPRWDVLTGTYTTGNRNQMKYPAPQTAMMGKCDVVQLSVKSRTDVGDGISLTGDSFKGEMVKRALLNSTDVKMEDIYSEIDRRDVTPSIASPEIIQHLVDSMSKKKKSTKKLNKNKIRVKNGYRQHNISRSYPLTVNVAKVESIRARRYFGQKTKSVINDYMMMKAQMSDELIKTTISRRNDRFLPKPVDKLVTKTAINEKQCSLTTLKMRRIVSPLYSNKSPSPSPYKRYKRFKLTPFCRYLAKSCFGLELLVELQPRHSGDVQEDCVVPILPPQHMAAVSGDLDLMVFVLGTTSADVLNTPVNGILPLSAACAHLDFRMVGLLFEHGAKPHGSCILASCMGYTYLMKRVSQVASVFRSDWSSHIRNSMESRLDLVRYLVKKGCQVDYEEPNLGNGLMWAMISEDWKVAEFLLDTGKTPIKMVPPLVRMMKRANDNLCCKLITILKNQTLTSEDEKCLHGVCKAASERSTAVVLKTLFQEILEPLMTDNTQPLYRIDNRSINLIVELLSAQGLVDELHSTFVFLAKKNPDSEFIFRANPIVCAFDEEQWTTVEFLILNGFLPERYLDHPPRSSIKPGNHRERLVKILDLATFAKHRGFTVLHAASAFGEKDILEEILKQPLSSVMLASLVNHPCIVAALSFQNDCYKMCVDRIIWKPERDTKNPDNVPMFLSSLTDMDKIIRFLKSELLAQKINFRDNALYGRISQLPRGLPTRSTEGSFNVENISDFLNRILVKNNIDENVLLAIAVTAGRNLYSSILEILRNKSSTEHMLRDLVDGFTFLDLLVIFSGYHDRCVLENSRSTQREDHKVIERLISKEKCKIKSLTLKIANRNNQLSILTVILEAMIRGNENFESKDIEEWIPVLYNASRQGNKKFLDMFFKVKPPTEELVYKCLAICIFRGHDELVAYLLTLVDINLLKTFTLPFGSKMPKMSILECLCRTRFFENIYRRLTHLLGSETLTKSHYICVCKTGALELWTNIYQSSEASTNLFEYLEVASSAGHEQFSMKLFEFKEYFSQVRIQEEVIKRGILHSACRLNMSRFLDMILQVIEKTESIKEALMSPDAHGITPLDYAKLMGHVNLYLKLTSDHSVSLTLEHHETYSAAFGHLRLLLQENESKEKGLGSFNTFTIFKNKYSLLNIENLPFLEARRTEIASYVIARNLVALSAYVRTQRELIVSRIKTDYRNYPYLRLLITRDCDDCFKLLLGYLGDDAFDALPSLSGEFDFLVRLACRCEAKACLKILFEREKILDYKSDFGDNILHSVAKLGDEEIISLMNDRCSAEMRKATNNRGEIPAMVSAGLGNHKLVPLLLKDVDLDEVSIGHNNHDWKEQKCIKCIRKSCIGWSKMYQQKLSGSDPAMTDVQQTRLMQEITSLSSYKTPVSLTLYDWVSNRRQWQLESGQDGMDRDVLMTVLLETMGFNGATNKLTEVVGDDIIPQLLRRPNLEELAKLIFQNSSLSTETSAAILLKLAVQYNSLHVIKIIEENDKEIILDSGNDAFSEAIGAGHVLLAEHILKLIADSGKSLDDHLQLLREIQEAVPLKVSLSCGLTLPGGEGWNKDDTTFSDSDCLTIMCQESFPLMDKISDSALTEAMIPEYICGKKLVVDVNKFEQRCPGIAPVDLQRRIVTEILQRYPRFICQESKTWEQLDSIHVGCLNVSDAKKPDVFLKGDVLSDTVQIMVEDQGKSFHIQCSNTAPKELSYEYYMETTITDSVIPDLMDFIKNDLEMEVKIKVDWSSIYSQNVPAATILTVMLESVWSKLGGLQSILESCSIYMRRLKEEYPKLMVHNVQMLIKQIAEIEVRYVHELSPKYTKYNYGKLGSVIRWEFTLDKDNHLMYNADNFPMYDILRTCYLANNAIENQSLPLLRRSVDPNPNRRDTLKEQRYQTVVNLGSFSPMGIYARKFFAQNVCPEVEKLIIAVRSLSSLPLQVDTLVIRNSATRNASLSYSLLDKTISIEVHSVQNGNQWDLINNDFDRELAKVERELILEDESFSKWRESKTAELQSDFKSAEMSAKESIEIPNKNERDQLNTDETTGSPTHEGEVTPTDELHKLTIDGSAQFKRDFPLDVTVSTFTDLIVDSRLIELQDKSSMTHIFNWMSYNSTQFLRNLFENVDFALRNYFMCSFVGYSTIPSGIWEPLDEASEQSEPNVLIMTDEKRPTFRLKKEDENLEKVLRRWRLIRFSKIGKGLQGRTSYLISFNHRLYRALDTTALELCISVLPRKIEFDTKSSRFGVKFVLQGFDRERIMPGDDFLKICREVTSGVLREDCGLGNMCYRGLYCGVDITCDVTGLTELWKENAGIKLRFVCDQLKDQIRLLKSLKIWGSVLTSIHIGVGSTDEDETRNMISEQGVSISIRSPNGLDIIFNKEESLDFTSVFLVSVSRLVGGYLKTKVEASLRKLSSVLKIYVVGLRAPSEFEQYANNCFTLCFSFCPAVDFIIDNFDNPLETICHQASKLCLDPNVPEKRLQCIHYSKDTLYIRTPLYTLFPATKIIEELAKDTKERSLVFFEPLIIGNKIFTKETDSLSMIYVKCKRFAPGEMPVEDMKVALHRELNRKTGKQLPETQYVDIENIHVLDEKNDILEARFPSSSRFASQVDLSYFNTRHLLVTKGFEDVSWLQKSGLFAPGDFCLSIVKTCHCDTKSQPDKDATIERSIPKKRRQFARIHNQYYEGGLIIDFGDNPSHNFRILAPNNKDSTLFVVSKRTIDFQSASLTAICRVCYEPCVIGSSFESFTNEPVELNFLPV